MNLGNITLLEHADKAWCNYQRAIKLVSDYDQERTRGFTPSDELASGMELIRKCLPVFETLYNKALDDWEKSFTQPTAYMEYQKLNTWLLHLIMSNEGDGDRADEIRDEMDDLWKKMTDEEQEAVRKHNEKALGDK